MEKDGVRVSTSGNAFDGPFDMVTYPDVDLGFKFAFGPFEVNSENELLISFGVSAHFAVGGYINLSFNITEYFERIRNK